MKGETIKWIREPLWERTTFTNNKDNPIIFNMTLERDLMSGILGIGFYGERDTEFLFWSSATISAFYQEHTENNFIKKTSLAPFEPSREINFTLYDKNAWFFNRGGRIITQIGLPELIGRDFSIMVAFYGFQAQLVK